MGWMNKAYKKHNQQNQKFLSYAQYNHNQTLKPDIFNYPGMNDTYLS